MAEENRELQQTGNVPSETSRTRVGFPEQKEPKKFSKKPIVIIVIFLLLALGGWWLFSGRNKESSLVEDEEASTPTPFKEESTPTPKVEIDRAAVKIQVLNGTGITGGAGTLKGSLEKVGYSQIDVGNASPQSFTATEVLFGEDVTASVKADIGKILEELYQDVEVKEKSLPKYDIRITTGYPKGYSASPTSKPKITLTPSPAATSTTPTAKPPTGSPTVAPTRTATPTPTP